MGQPRLCFTAVVLRHSAPYAAIEACPCLPAATETGAFGVAMLFDLLVGKFLAPGGAGWPGVLKVLLGAACAAAVVTTIFMEQVTFV